VITLGSQSGAVPPSNARHRAYWQVDSLSRVGGSDEEQSRAYRVVLNQIESYVRRLVNSKLDRDLLYAAGEPLRILILCTANSALGHLAEGWFRTLGRGVVEVTSAGMTPAAQVHPLAVQVMAEHGINISAQRPKAAADLFGYYDYVITVCDQARDNCPNFPSTTARLHWSYPDPAAAEPDERLAAFRTTCNRLEQQTHEFLGQWLGRHRPELLVKAAT